MGYRIILLLIVFLIIIGGISILLGQKQTNAKTDLSEAFIIKQSQQLANSYVQDAIRDLTDSINNGNGVPLAYLFATGGKTIGQGSSHIANIIIHEDNYTDANGTDHELINQYYIVCEVTTTAPDGTQFITGTNALYQAGDDTPYWDSEDYIDPVMGGSSRYIRMMIEEDNYYFFQINQAQDDQTTWQHLGKQSHLSHLDQNIDDMDNFNNIIYFRANSVKPGIGGDGAPAVVINAQGGNGNNPTLISRDLTLIVEGNIRIEGRFQVANPDVRINLIALPYPDPNDPTSTVPGKIYTNTRQSQNPGGPIQAYLYTQGPNATNAGNSNIVIGSDWTHIPPYTRNALTNFDIGNIIETIVNPGTGVTPPDPADLEKKLMSWEERLVQVIRP